MKRTFTFLVSLFLCAGTMLKAGPTDLPQITTDLNNPIYYTIYNTRSAEPGGLMYYAGDEVGLKDGCSSTVLEDKYQFFFTGTHDSMYIHNKATANKLASVSSWTEAGAEWAVGVSPMGGGLAFGPKGGLDSNDCWNDKNYATNETTSDFTKWSANDAGSIFVAELVSSWVFPVADLFYVIECPLFEKAQGEAGKKAIYVNGEGKSVWGAEDLANHNFYWIPVAVDGGVALKNFGTNKYLSKADGTMTDEPVAVTFKALGDNSFNIRLDGALHAGGHSGGAGLSGWLTSWDGALGSASAWRFVQKEDPTALTEVVVTYSFTYGGEEKFTQTTTTFVGEEWPAVVVPYGVSASKPEGVIAEADVVDGNAKKTIELTLNLPFAVSDENTINAILISSHSVDNLKWRAEGTDITVQSGAEADSDNYKWAIYSAWNEGELTFTIKNLGTGKYIYSTSADNSHDQGVVTLADEGSVFTFEANNRFKLATGKYLSVNSSRDTNVQYLGTWGAHGGTNNKFIACEYEVVPEVEYADEAVINAFIAEVSAIGELPYDLDATWTSLPAVLASLEALNPLIEQIELGNPVAKADVEAATKTVANANAVAVYYNETYAPTAEAAADLLAALENGSEEYTALSAAIAACDLSAVMTVAELETINAALAEAVEANTPEGGVVKTDYTDAIKNASVAEKADWEGGLSHGNGGLYKTSAESFDFTQTITLPAGQYKMTAQVAYRYAGSNDTPTSEEFEYNQIQAGAETHLAKLYAQTSTYKYEANVQNRWEGASDTNYAGDGVSTVNGKFVPNSSNAVKAWFDAGMYVNELVFNVQEDGEVKIGVAKSAKAPNGDYTNIGAWTLTRLGDAEADPKEEEPTPEEPEGDVTNLYLKNAGFDDASSWVTEGNVDKAAKDVANWTVTTTGDSWYYGAALGYGSAAMVNNAAIPATNPEGVAEGGALGISVGWECVVEYTQDVVLPAGVYTLTYKVINVNNGATQGANYFGFKSGSTTYYGKTTNFTYNVWEEHSTTFVLREETAGAISVGIGAVTGGSGANAKIFIDGVTLSYEAEVPEEVPALFADGDYLIVNTATGCYLGGGNDWGTHATLLKKPQFFTLTHKGDNAYTLDSHQSNGGDSHFLGANLYCDSGAAYWTFAKKDNGSYTISNGDNYLTGNGAGNVIITAADATAATAEWTIISRADAFAALDAATQEAPMDATVYITNPECKRNAGGWTTTSADGTAAAGNLAMGGGGANANCAESYHSNNGFDMSQVLEGLKPGVYRLDGHAFYRDDNDQIGTLPYFYVNEQKSNFLKLTGSENNMNSAYLSFLNGSYAVQPIYFNVTEGESVKIGVHGENTAFWNIWGEFGLTYYGAEASIAEIKAGAVYTDYNKTIGKPMSGELQLAMETAKAAFEADPSDENLATFTSAVVAAVASVDAYANNKLAIDAMFALMESTNVYTMEAYEAYKATAEDFLAQYEARTLNAVVDNPAAIHGWHASVDYDDMLLSAFGVKDFDTNLYINTWSGEGETDGSEFKVPFFEYWVGDGESLGATTKTATVTGLTPGMCYTAEAWVRVRAKNGVAAADATGITLSVGEGEATDVTEGEVIGNSQFSHAVFTATGVADAEGNLTININVLDGNNISWLAFKNLKYTEVEVVEPEYLTVVSAMAGDVEIVEGAATVESISSFDITFDRPVALAEDAEWATLTDSWGDNSLKAEVLEDNKCVVRFSLQWEQVFTDAGEFYLYVPEGVVVGADDANFINAAIEAVITIEAAPATPLIVTNVTVGEDVMEGFTAVATPEDMIKVNFDGQFYFQGMPSIVDAEGNDASEFFMFANGLDVDGSNSYIFQGMNAGTYTITMPKASFMNMMQWKAPAEDIVLTVQIVVEPEMLSVVGAKVGDVAIVEGAATVESISNFEITFDRPVALAEDADWATLTDKWGDTSLKAEVLEENDCVVRFSLQWDVYTEAGDYYLYIPEGVVVDAEDANSINAAIEAVVTIEGGSVEPATPLAVVNVTVGEDVMEGFTVVATTEDMIKVNFDGKFYFQGSPVIVDAEGKEAPMAFEYMNGLDMDGSNSYIFMGKTEGIYTITLPKTQFNEFEMMGWKAPAEDIVLTVQITLPQGIDNINVDAETVIYDIHGRRVEKMEKGVYIVNGKKVIKK